MKVLDVWWRSVYQGGFLKEEDVGLSFGQGLKE